ncbi:hypothetical protein KJ633_06670 [bacterium]|nr:hypothetical protein [bacterium]
MTCPIFALPPAGPLAQISSAADPAGEFRSDIDGSETIEVSFRKIMKIKGSEKSFIENGKIYYKKEPLLFRAELPGEALQIEGKARKRFVKKHNEIYIDDWTGGNPLFVYFDIPGGVYEAGSSSACIVFCAERDGDKIEAIYGRKEKMLKSVKVENPIMETFTEIESWVKNAEIPPEVFAFPRGAKRIDMRK